MVCVAICAVVYRRPSCNTDVRLTAIPLTLFFPPLQCWIFIGWTVSCGLFQTCHFQGFCPSWYGYDIAVFANAVILSQRQYFAEWLIWSAVSEDICFVASCQLLVQYYVRNPIYFLVGVSKDAAEWAGIITRVIRFKSVPVQCSMRHFGHRVDCVSFIRNREISVY